MSNERRQACISRTDYFWEFCVANERLSEEHRHHFSSCFRPAQLRLSRPFEHRCEAVLSPWRKAGAQPCTYIAAQKRRDSHRDGSLRASVASGRPLQDMPITSANTCCRIERTQHLLRRRKITQSVRPKPFVLFRLYLPWQLHLL